MKRRTSNLTRATTFYLQTRRRLGFRLKSEGWALPSLARYARRREHRGALTSKLAIDWAQSSTQASPPQRACRLNLVRRFARFWQRFDPRTQIPPAGLFGPTFRRRPVHIYSDQEVHHLLASTVILGSGLRAANLRTLLGLLRCTGLRVSEALGLREGDVDWHQRVLTIRQSKSGQPRFVPVRADTLAALRNYARLRQRCHPLNPTGAFWLSTTGAPLSYGTVRDAFLQLRRHLGWHQRPVPRLHDLRHTFAVDCLLGWCRRGQPVGTRIAALSTYLGHRQVTDTYWYLTAVPELMAWVSRRFQSFASSRHE
ncbi:MAG TPA: tyrosine-type recombinase/integrase [Verrucomicrobiae bacterium]